MRRTSISLFASAACAFLILERGAKAQEPPTTPAGMVETMRRIGERAGAASARMAAEAGKPLVFENLYSRPNDDTFQNQLGNAGEPYEVSRVRVALVVTPKPEGERAVRVEWSAEMTTGRHVEAGASFALAVSETSIGEGKPVVPLAIRYPKGADAKSLPADKIGSVMHAAVDLGSFREDGKHDGVLHVAVASAGGDGTTQLIGQRLPNGGVFQELRWSLSAKDGAIKDADIRVMRFKEPHMRLIESNFIEIDREAKEHRPYPAQPPAAAEREELVGDFGLATARIAASIRRAGCLDCHGPGNKDLHMFHDDGVPLRPVADARQLNALLGEGVDWDDYPRGMKTAAERLKEDRELFLEWLKLAAKEE